MNWQSLIISGVIVALAAGCGSETTIEAPEAEAAAESQLAPVPDGPAASVDAPQADEHEKFLAPFPENTSFFAPPAKKMTVAPSDLSSRDGGHLKVRVIGFSRLGDSDQQAILEVEGQLEVVSTGDAIRGIGVIEINEPQVTLQQKNERWTVALFNQPLIHEPVSHSTSHGTSFPSTASRSGTRSNTVNRRPPSWPSIQSVDSRASGRADSTPERDHASGAIRHFELPPLPESPQSGEVPNAFSLPDELALPEPIELPKAPDLPDAALPGLDQLPGLPSP